MDSCKQTQNSARNIPPTARRAINFLGIDRKDQNHDESDHYSYYDRNHQESDYSNKIANWLQGSLELPRC